MRLTDHVHALRIPFKIAARPGIELDRFVYAYLIVGRKFCLIDAGVASSEKLIFDYMREIGLSPEDISLVVLTHSHPDHIGSAKAIKEATGCTVAAHPLDKPWIEDVDLQSRERPVPGFSSLVGRSVEVDRTIDEGDILDLGEDLGLEVFHTPGHSRGSVSLLLRRDGTLFSGDAVPIPGSLPIYDDFSESVKSVEKLRGIPGIHLLLSSWDEPREDERAYRLMDESLSYLRHIQEVVARVAGSRPSMDSMELCRQVVKELGLPEAVAIPMLARSFQANLRALGGK